MTTPSPEPRWLNEDDGEVWVAFVSMLIWLPTALDDQLQRDSSMSHYEYGILAALSGADAATLRMSELAMFANGSLPRLSRAVARLEGRKWVTRKPDPADGRYTLAVLTDKGRKVLVEAAPGHVEAVNRLVFDVLTTAQARQLGIITRRILKAIDSETDLISRLLPKFGHVSSLWGSGRGEPDARCSSGAAGAE